MKKTVQFLSLLLTLSILFSAAFSGTASAAQEPMVKCDTTSNFTLAQNSSYTFQLTVTGSSQAPSFTVGNGSVLSTRLKSKKGNAYNFQVTAIGNPGTSSAIYTTLSGQTAQRQCVITVGKPALTGSTYDQAEQVAESVVKMALTSNMTNYQKYMALANVAEVGYDHTLQPDSFTAYGDLVKGTAVCSGMASAFQLLCDKAGLPCKSVISTKLNHEWNMIYVEGNWYHIDMQDLNRYLESDKEHLKNGDRTIMDDYEDLPVCSKDGVKQKFQQNQLDGWVKTASEPSFSWKGKTYVIKDNWILSQTGEKLMDVPNLDAWNPSYNVPSQIFFTPSGIFIYRTTGEATAPGDFIKLDPETGKTETILSNKCITGHTINLYYDRQLRCYGYRIYYFDPTKTTWDYHNTHSDDDLSIIIN